MKATLLHLKHREVIMSRGLLLFVVSCTILSNSALQSFGQEKRSLRAKQAIVIEKEPSDVSPSKSRLSKTLDRTMDANMIPGETKTWNYRYLGRTYAGYNYYTHDTIQLPAFMTYQDLRITLSYSWPATWNIYVDFTLIAAPDATLGEHQIIIKYYLMNTPGGAAMHSETLTINLSIRPVATPDDLMANVVDNEQIDLTWSDNSDNETGFKIERRAGEQPFTEIARVDANTTSYIDANHDLLTGYTYRVSGFNNDGNSIYSNETIAFSSLIEQVIADDINGAISVYPADLDGDGDNDILGAEYTEDAIHWWENDGAMNFSKHTIADDYRDPTAILGIDMDGDQKMDLLTGVWSNSGLAWWDNDGSQNFTKNTLNIYVFTYSISADDIDKDGDMDIISSDVYNGRVSRWENDGSQNFERHMIDENLDDVRSIHVSDIDGDGDYDIAGAGGGWSEGLVKWYENDGAGNFTEHIVSTDFQGAISVFSVDLDGDSDMDLVCAAEYSTNQIVWFENDGAQQFSMHMITDAQGSASLNAVDIDEDGDIDVISGQITVWKNDGSENFTKHSIRTDFEDTRSIIVTDFNGNGAIDILAASYEGDKISLWQNLSKVGVNSDHGDQLPRDFTLLQNYPNPFNPETVIGYQLPAVSRVELIILNILGQKIRTLINEEQPAGKYSVVWNGKDHSGNSVVSGLYFYRLTTEDRVWMKKMTLLK